MAFILAMTLALTGFMNIKNWGVNCTPRQDRHNTKLRRSLSQLVLLSLFLSLQVILELMRYMTTTPLLVPHSTTTDVELAGYYLPQGTGVSRAGYYLPKGTGVSRAGYYLPKGTGVSRAGYYLPKGTGVSRAGWVLPA